MRLRALTHADIPFSLRLTGAAGWNQTPADWETFLALRPHGCFLAEWEGKPAGTVTTIDHGGSLGWIGMLLVASDLQGRGIGTRLLRAAIESLSTCETVKLDATPAGRKVYLPLGFVDETELERRVREHAAGKNPGPVEAPPGVSIARLAAQEIADIARFDAAAFGADRAPLIDAWHHARPEYAFVARRQGAVEGYCLGRPGRRREHLGPIVADSFAVARLLVASALEAVGERAVLLDVFNGNPEWLRLLDGLGFTVERGFTRMRFGPGGSPERPDAQWAIAGPEVG